MSSTNTTDTQGLGAQAQIPAERAFQIDPGGLGGLAQSVNLFRGDVNVPITVVSLTTRGGIDAGLALVYNSNVGEQVDTWNLAAPTGPVGLGWSLGYEFIARDPALAAKPIDGVSYLVAEGSANRLFRTAITADYWEYEAENYLFWRIRYYPREEQWEIVQEDGTRRLYGGRAANGNDSAIQYGIKWVGADGNWNDATVVTSGQSRYAVGWNLREIAPPSGDGVTMEYENISATIGDNAGLSYTVTSRLKRVVAPAVRTLAFNYLPKQHDEAVREYQVPHYDANTPSLHAYQDRYETHYLASVEVLNADDAPSAPGALIQHIEFEYALANLSLDHQGDPDFFKRYLTAVTYTTPEGLPLPDMRFDYYNDPAHDLDAGIHRGALKSILYPQGGRVDYRYRQTVLDGTDRATTIATRGIPRVWFGPDYTVLVSSDAARRGLTVRVFSWNGLWVEAPSSYTLPHDIDLATLEVSTQPEFFALGCRTAGNAPDYVVLLFHKEKGRYGQWIAEKTFTTLPLQGDAQALLATGTDFAVALTSGPNFVAKVWSERTGSWADESSRFAIPPHASYALGASADYVCLASADASSGRTQLQIWYRTRNTTGFGAGKIDHDSLTGVDWQPDSTPRTFWSPGNCFASMTYVNGGDDHSIRYTVKVLQWDDTFFARTVLDEAYTIDAKTKLPYAQAVVSGSVLGNVDHLFRYDGQAWQPGALPVLENGDAAPRFIYGNDVAVISGKANAAIALFDPYRPKWNAAVEVPVSQLGITPTVNGDFLSVDRDVYYRDPANRLQLVHVIDSNAVPQSLVNRAPYFIAYEDQSGNTHVLPLANGRVDAGAAIVLKNERIYVPDGGDGTLLAGPSALMTYQGSFDSPAALRLYQFAKHGIEGPLACYPVQSLAIDDGYADNWGGVWSAASKSSSFYYDCGHVTMTPDGLIAEFATATTVYGMRNTGSGVAYPPPADTPFGRSEYRYHNNRTPQSAGLVPHDGMLEESAVYYYSYLSGMLFDQTDYDAEGLPVERTYNRYEVRTEVASIDDENLRTPLIGGYVKRPATEISQYEQVIDVAVQAGTAASRTAVAIPAGLQQALAARGVDLAAGAILVPDHGGAHWALYPDAASPRYLPVSIRGTSLKASVAVTRRVGSGFSWQTGLLTSDFTENYNSSGKHEVVSREVYRAWQVSAYAQLKADHVWAPVAVSIKFWREDGMAGRGVPQAISVNTWSTWGSRGLWAPRRNFTAASADAYDPLSPVGVHFDAWDNASLPPLDLWRPSGEITQRDSRGSTLEARDAFNRPTATLLNRRGTARIAEFTNATNAETLYTGFETYEDLDRWQLNGQPVPDAALSSGDAHTGRRSLRMAGDPSQTLATRLTISGGKTYILSCWVKTPADFESAPGRAQWSVSGDGAPTLTFDIAGTGGTWSYQHWAFALPEAESSRAVTLQLRNDKTAPQGTLLLDDVMLAPLVGTAVASVYDERYGAQIATIALNGNTSRTFFDSRQRTAAQVSAAGNVVAGTITELVRENNQHAAFRFDPAQPNSVVSIGAPEGGAYADLVQGDAWITQWVAANPAAWRPEDGVLMHTESSADSIGFRPTDGLDDYGARLTVRLPVDSAGTPRLPQQPIGLDIGTDLSLRWTPAAGWRLTLGGTTHELGAGPFANDWAVLAPVDPVSGKTSVHVYADGRLLFGQADSSRVSGTLSLHVAERGIGFASIATFRAPSLSAVFLDGSGKERQRQSFAGDGTLVSGSLYDPIGRPAIGVKPAAAPGRTLAYDTDYVQSFDPTSGVMTGRAASANPDDDGYPYVRTEFFRTAQSLASKQGAPGRRLALAYGGGADGFADLNPHVLQFQYGTNVQGQFGGDAWPSNQYFVKCITDPNGVASYTLTCQTGETLASLSGPGDGTLAITQYFYDGSGRLVKMLPPNGVQAARAGHPDADRWASTTTYNFLGEGIESNEPDAGLTRTVFGPGSVARFVAGADDPDGLATLRYVKYDAIGREIETGSVRTAWNRAELERIALLDPQWPGTAQQPVISGVNVYDGDGSNATQFGQLTSSTTYSGNGRDQVEQRYEYSAAGQLVAQTQTADAYDAQARTIRYAYNAGGQLVGVGYPDGSPIAHVTYRYTRLGQIYQVGTPEDAASIARYRYTAAGQVEHAEVRLSDAAQLTSLAHYGPPGWLSQITTGSSAQPTVLQETLTYTEGGYQGAGFYDGKIASAQFSDAGGTHRYEYAYDDLSRLRVAQREEGADTRTDVALTYDLNGNIATLDTGGTPATYHYAPGSDQVDSVTSGGTSLDAFRYNAMGAAIASLRRNLADVSYDPATGLTDAMTLGNGHQLIFGYDARQSRTVKRVTDAAGSELSARLYVRNNSGSPLLELSRTAGLADSAVQYLHGPAGLIGMQAHGKRYAVVRDHLGSVRSVVDETGAVVAQYDYTSFGVTVTRAGSSQPDIVYYRYTGQELDPETGLYNYQARFYDPELGRFIAVDPKRQGASPYVYVLNNPIGLIDPDGEEALTAFLIAVIVGAIIGAVVGGVTYIVTHKGNFDVGKFFAYAAVGLVAGAAGGAAAFTGGLMATAAAGAVGVSTSTSIGSGIFVGAVAGAADGAVAGTLNQMGVNLIEGRPIGEGVGQAAWMGAAIGGATGAVLGGITGAVNYRTATRLTNPDEVISARPLGQHYAALKNANLSGYTRGEIQAVGNGAGRNDVVGLVAHGSRTRDTLRFVDVPQVNVGAGLPKQQVGDVVADLTQGGAFGGRGIDLSGMCHAGNNGVARTLARELNVPVRAATGETSYFLNYATQSYWGRTIAGGDSFITIGNSLRGVAYRTYYPSQLRTGWNYLFGY
ncbi:RHS repeat-associated core domain-containing protein [Paraburkholderia sp. J12]|uniref:RHS repeat domain-containing protein n=1 Tax=Paraburkholderia sp. J12 TaxID=2805432 RepID=UPI002ABE0E2F|nr:RHS repeat-associated core domain-containing protein [Paraburkholderia sp. J12]